MLSFGTCVYGKVSKTPEFVGALTRAEGEWVNWLEHANGYACIEGAEAWQRAYHAGAPHAFIFNPATGKTVTGVAVPSYDSKARLYPLMAVASLDKEVVAPGLAYLPVGGERFFLRAGEGIRDARNAGVLSPAAVALTSLERPQHSQLDAARRDFADWQSIPGQVGKLWHALFPGGGADAALRAIEAIAHAAGVLRAKPGENDRRYVRLPLGMGGSAAASFWLHVLIGLMGNETAICIAAWSLEPYGTIIASIANNTNEPPMDFWLRLWLSELRDSLLLDASAMVFPDVRATALKVEVARVVRSRDATIRDLLAVIGA